MRFPKKILGLVVLASSVLLLAAGKPARAQECVLNERQKLNASDGVPLDRFGTSVAIDGDRAIVGAPGGTDSLVTPGTGYVFRRDDNGTPLDPGDDIWVQEAKLTAADAGRADRFGFSVSISGDRAVVGTPRDDDAGFSSGSAYVFRRDDNGTPLDPSDDLWIQEAKLTAADAASGDTFGSSVSTSGDRVVVGAPLDDDAGDYSGSAYVFRRDDNGTPSDASDDFWVEEAKLTASDAVADEGFGFAVSLRGNWVVVGGFRNDAGNDAYVFRHDDNGTPTDPNDDLWVEEAKLIPADPTFGFGRSVGIGDDTIVVGASNDDDAGTGAGAAYVFRREDNGTPLDQSDDSWVQQAKLTALETDEFDHFGASVSLSRDRIIVGASASNSGLGPFYLFRRDDNGTPSDPMDDLWTEEVTFVASDATFSGYLWLVVSISGDHIIAGAPRDNDLGPSSGSVYMFEAGPFGTCCTQQACSDGIGACCPDPGAVFFPGRSCADAAPCACESDGQCDDGNPCTDDSCADVCQNLPDDTNDPDDGLSCNGVEDFCQNGEISYAAAPPNCDDGIFCTIDTCDLEIDACVSNAVGGYCVIDGTCYVHRTRNPVEACETCDFVANSTSWTPVPPGEQCALTVECIPVGGSTVIGGQWGQAECIVTTDVDQTFLGAQQSFGCDGLPGEPGSTGRIALYPAYVDIGHEDPPFLFDPVFTGASVPGIGPSIGCFGVGQAPPPSVPPVTALVPAGESAHLFTVSYQVSDCATGDFVFELTNFSNPPNRYDPTRFLDADGNLIPFNFTPLTLTAVPRPYGDVFPPGGDGLIDIDDIVCGLLGFTDMASCPEADLIPCEGNGVIDLDDILALLQAFAGNSPCSSCDTAGACCDRDRACIDGLLRSECEFPFGLGGTYQGAGTTCAEVSCQ